MADAPPPAPTSPDDEAGPNYSLLLQRLTRATRTAGLGSEQRANRLNPEKLEAIFRQEPLLQRAVYMHAGDLVKMGFDLVDKKGDPLPGGDVVAAWFRDAFWTARTQEAIVGAHVHGDGLVEIEWDDTRDATQAPPASSLPVALHVIDPATCDFEPFTDKDGRTRDMLVQRAGGDVVRLHPDRYHHLVLKKLPGYKHGLSSVEAAAHAAIAKIKGDQGSGEAVYYAGVGKQLFTLANASDPELEAVAAMVANPDFIRAFIWNDRLKAQELNPTVLDPAPFYAAWKGSICAAVPVPEALVTGVNAGGVTGSETNLTHYHGDLLQVDKTVLEPFVVRLVVGLTGYEPGEFDVKWREWPVSKQQEAATLRELSTALLNLDTFGLTKEAAARLAGLQVTKEDFKPEPPPGFLPPVSPMLQPGEAPPDGNAEDAAPAQDEAGGDDAPAAQR